MEGETGAGAEDHKKGLWTAEEDKVLTDYVKLHGKGQWNRIANKTGLKRCGKSCRLRWMNYLSPTVNRGSFTVEEEDLIARLHKLIGNRWSLIAKRVPGRTDNQVKNYWNTHLSKKLGIKKHRNGNNRTRNAVLSIVQKDDNKVCDTSALSHVNTSGSDEAMVDRGIGEEHEALVVEKMTTSQSYADSICGFDYEFELSTIDLLNHYAAGAGFDWQCL